MTTKTRNDCRKKEQSKQKKKTEENTLAIHTEVEDPKHII